MYIRTYIELTSKKMSFIGQVVTVALYGKSQCDQMASLFAQFSAIFNMKD